MADRSAPPSEAVPERGIPQIARHGGQLRRRITFATVVGLGLLWLLNRPAADGAPTVTTAPLDQSFAVAAPALEAAIQESIAELEPPPPVVAKPTYSSPQRRHRRPSRAELETSRKRLRSEILLPSPARSTSPPSAPVVATLNSPAPLRDVFERAATGASFQPEERFATRASRGSVNTVEAEFIDNLSTTLVQGTMIRAVLETGIVSSLAGYTRAVVSEPGVSFDGRRRLVPKGSRLVGQYHAGVVQGQERVFVIWTRLIRPDGAAITLQAPGTDPTGVTGQPGEVGTHFFKRFGGSILLSMIDGAIAAGVNATQQAETSTVVNGTGSGLKDAAREALAHSINISPTIHVPHGTAIQIFVTQDLDFTRVGAMR